ncbi:MAG: hypothetical protein M3081_12265 [Gemmatimonadota bacterium]|nr:hypothetical protein [Gemmatimonadota bacterium]
MSIRRPTPGSRIRQTLTNQFVADGYRASARMTERVKLDYVLRVRSELSAGREDLMRMLGTSSLVQLLGDADTVVAYAETLAAEAAIRRAAGEESRAGAIEQRALAIALELQKTLPHPDAELDALIEALRERAK